MESLNSLLNDLFNFYLHHMEQINKVAFIILFMTAIIFIFNLLMKRYAKHRFSVQAILILSKIINYGGIVFTILLILAEFGITLTALLGAAGVAGIAIGFAAQTSLSNIISGFFLLGEKPFKPGDMVQIDNNSGVVNSMDLFSVKLKTVDNKLIRIPNEYLLKATVMNITHFPIRRLDLVLGVGYNEDLDRVFHVLQQVAANNPLCLVNPAPIIIFQNFNESSQDILFGVWATREDYLDLKNSIMKDIKKAFDAAKIEIPFPQRTINFASNNPQINVQLSQSSANLGK